MFRNLLINDQCLEISYKKAFGIFFLVLTYFLCFFIGILFMNIPFFENSGAKEFLYFGVFFVICGLIGLFKLPRQLNSFDKLLEFSADLQGVKYNHHIYEIEKIQFLKWEEISKIIITRKLVSKASFGSSKTSWNNILIYFKYQNSKQIGYIEGNEQHISISPNKENLTVLKFPKGAEAEISESMNLLANGLCPISEYKKVILDYRNNNEELIS